MDEPVRINHDLKLRNLHQEDASWLLEMYADKTSMKYRASNPLQSILDAKKMIIDSVQENKQRLGIELLSNHQLIGTFLETTLPNNAIKIGFSFHPNYQQKGYGTMLLEFLIAYYKKQQINQLIAIIHKEHQQSISLVKKFKFDKTRQDQHLITFSLLLN